MTGIFKAWREDMNTADRVRIILALGFPMGALGHFWWLIKHGDWLYRGPAPEWAVWFWYSLCVADCVICWLLIFHPRAGIASGMAAMAWSMWVNWRYFPTFEYQFNWVLLGLTGFGIFMLSVGPWLWRRSHWKP